MKTISVKFISYKDRGELLGITTDPMTEGCCEGCIFDQIDSASDFCLRSSNYSCGVREDGQDGIFIEIDPSEIPSAPSEPKEFAIWKETYIPSITIED